MNSIAINAGSSWEVPYNCFTILYDIKILNIGIPPLMDFIDISSHKIIPYHPSVFGNNVNSRNYSPHAKLGEIYNISHRPFYLRQYDVITTGNKSIEVPIFHDSCTEYTNEIFVISENKISNPDGVLVYPPLSGNSLNAKFYKCIKFLPTDLRAHLYVETTPNNAEMARIEPPPTETPEEPKHKKLYYKLLRVRVSDKDS